MLTKDETTRSPTATTVPAPSWPSTTGGGSGITPLAADRSLWQTPQAEIFTMTSPARGGSTQMSSTVTGAPCARAMTARAF